MENNPTFEDSNSGIFIPNKCTEDQSKTILVTDKNVDLIDTTGRKVSVGDTVLIFNENNPGTEKKWSLETVEKHEGKLYFCFPKYMGGILTQVSKVKKDHIVIIQSGSEYLLFLNDKFGFKK